MTHSFYVQCAPGLAQHDSLLHGPASAHCVSKVWLHMGHLCTAFALACVGFPLARAGSPLDFDIKLKGIFALLKGLTLEYLKLALLVLSPVTSSKEEIAKLCNPHLPLICNVCSWNLQWGRVSPRVLD